LPERRARQPRGCLPTLVIALIMVSIVGAGVIISNALSDRPAAAIEVGAGVSIRPPLEWSFVSRFDPGTGEDDGVVMTRGVATMIVYVSAAPAATELASLRAELGGSSLVSLGETEPVTVRVGRDGLRFAFSGALPELSSVPIEGEALAIQGQAVSAVFMTWSEVGSYQLLRGEISQLMGEATIP
jgi:hypothetical protein